MVCVSQMIWCLGRRLGWRVVLLPRRWSSTKITGWRWRGWRPHRPRHTGRTSGPRHCAARGRQGGRRGGHPGTSPSLSAMSSARRMVGSNPSSPKAAFRAQPSARATPASLASSGTPSLRVPGVSLLPCSAPGARCRVRFCRAFGDRRELVPDDGATVAKKHRQAVARCVYRVASGRGSGHCDSPRRVFTKNATEPRVIGEVSTGAPYWPL